MTTNEATAGLKVGDTVIVVDRSSGREGQTYRATVEKAARVWLTLIMVPDTKNGERYLRTWRLRRDTQGEGGTVYGHPTCFYTLEQWAAREAETDARKVLSAAGISVDYGSPFRTRLLIELAACVQGLMIADRKVTRDGV